MSKKKNLAKHLKRNFSKDQNFSPLEISVLKTLWYKQIFNCPMSLYEIKHFLVDQKIETREELKNTVNELFRKNLIEFGSGKYYFKHLHDALNPARKSNSVELINTSKEIIKNLSTIPWIKLISITGSVSALNANKNDDIDIFIIAEKNRVWLTRAFVVFMLKTMKAYRSEKDYAGKICPNIIIDESKLEWPKHRQNIYTANEILMMRPVYNKHETYIKFLNSNAWLNQFFPNFTWDQNLNNSSKEIPQSKILNIAEWIIQQLQKLYMARKKTTEITKPKFIHFNKFDWSQKILDEFAQFEALIK